jgi:hypothetical protein
LKVGQVSSIGDKVYCKPHYTQLFKLKGNYESGFQASAAQQAANNPDPTPAAEVTSSEPQLKKQVSARDLKQVFETKPVEATQPSPRAAEPSPRDTAAKPKFGGSLERCDKCAKILYFTDKIDVNGKVSFAL